MSAQNLPDFCKKCGDNLNGNYCSNCGNPKVLPKISGHLVLSEVASVLNFQKGILFTIRELLLKPGKNIKAFLHEDRNRLIKPISFVLLTSVIYTIAQYWLKFEDGYINYNNLDWGSSAVNVIMQWISNNYGVSNIIMASIIALWVKLFFRKYKYNYFEILILLFFVMGVEMLMFTVFGIAEGILEMKVLNNASPIAIIYFCWAIGDFFERKKIFNYVKALFSYLLGLISFIVSAIGLGMLIDFLTK